MTFRNVTITGFNSSTGVGPVLYDHSGGASVVLENRLVHGNTGE
jgi:hypothetical protein